MQDTELVDGVPNKHINRSVTVDDATTAQGDDMLARAVENEKDTDADAQTKDVEVENLGMELEEELFRQIERGTSLDTVSAETRKNDNEEVATNSGYAQGDWSPQPLKQTVALKILTKSFGQLSDNGQLPQSNSNTPSNKRRMPEEYNKHGDGKKKTKHNNSAGKEIKFCPAKECNKVIQILGQPGINGETKELEVFKERYQTRKNTQKAQTTETDEETAQLTKHPMPETTQEPKSNHEIQNMNTVTVNEHQNNITTAKRLTASNKVSYKDLDDESIARMMLIDDADAIEKAERAKTQGVFKNGTEVLKIFQMVAPENGEVLYIKPYQGWIRSFDRNEKLYIVEFEDKEVQKLTENEVEQAVLFKIKEKSKNDSCCDMKGTLIYKKKKKKGRQKFVIRGQWTTEESPDPKEFKLVHILAQDESPNVLPKEATFKGIFVHRKHVLMEESVDLSFNPDEADPTLYHVDGEGENELGFFEMKGTAKRRLSDGEYEVQLLKKYFAIP